MSQSRCFWIGLPVGVVSAPASARTAFQYSGGISSAGPTGRVVQVRLPEAAAGASLASCLGVGMGRLAGRRSYEVRSESEYFDDIQDVKVTRDMLDLARHIVNQKTGKFECSRY